MLLIKWSSNQSRKNCHAERKRGAALQITLATAKIFNWRTPVLTLSALTLSLSKTLCRFASEVGTALVNLRLWGWLTVGWVVSVMVGWGLSVTVGWGLSVIVGWGVSIIVCWGAAIVVGLGVSVVVVYDGAVDLATSEPSNLMASPSASQSSQPSFSSPGDSASAISVSS